MEWSSWMAGDLDEALDGEEFSSWMDPNGLIMDDFDTVGIAPMPSQMAQSMPPQMPSQIPPADLPSAGMPSAGMPPGGISAQMSGQFASQMPPVAPPGGPTMSQTPGPNARQMQGDLDFARSQSVNADRSQMFRSPKAGSAFAAPDPGAQNVIQPIPLANASNGPSPATVPSPAVHSPVVSGAAKAGNTGFGAGARGLQGPGGPLQGPPGMSNSVPPQMRSRPGMAPGAGMTPGAGMASGAGMAPGAGMASGPEMGGMGAGGGAGAAMSTSGSSGKGNSGSPSMVASASPAMSASAPPGMNSGPLGMGPSRPPTGPPNPAMGMPSRMSPSMGPGMSPNMHSMPARMTPNMSYRMSPQIPPAQAAAARPPPGMSPHMPPGMSPQVAQNMPPQAPDVRRVRTPSVKDEPTVQKAGAAETSDARVRRTLIAFTLYTQALRAGSQVVNLSEVVRRVDSFSVGEQRMMVAKFERGRDGSMTPLAGLPITRLLPQVFWRTLSDVYAQVQRQPIPEQVMFQGHRIPLMVLFQYVQLCGGTVQAAVSDSWPAIANTLGLSLGNDGAQAVELIALYVNTMLPFEMFANRNEVIRRNLVLKLGPPRMPPPSLAQGRAGEAVPASAEADAAIAQGRPAGPRTAAAPVQTAGSPSMPPARPPTETPAGFSMGPTPPLVGQLGPGSLVPPGPRGPGRPPGPARQAARSTGRPPGRPPGSVRPPGPPGTAPSYTGPPHVGSAGPVMPPTLRGPPNLAGPPVVTASTALPGAPQLGGPPVDVPGMGPVPGIGAPGLAGDGIKTAEKRVYPLEAATKRQRHSELEPVISTFDRLVEGGEYLLQRQHTSTHGGRDIKALSLLGNDIQNWHSDVAYPLDLGTVDLHAVTCSLASRIPAEVRQALDKLAAVSANPKVHASVQHCPRLLANLCDLILSMIHQLLEPPKQNASFSTYAPRTCASRKVDLEADELHLLANRDGVFSAMNRILKEMRDDPLKEGKEHGEIEVEVDPKTGVETGATFERAQAKYGQDKFTETTWMYANSLKDPDDEENCEILESDQKSANDKWEPYAPEFTSDLAKPYYFPSYSARYERVDTEMFSLSEVKDEKSNFWLTTLCDRLLLATCVLRNLSFSVANRPVIAHKPEFQRLLWQWLQIMAENPKLMDSELRTLDLCKDFLIVLENVSLYLRLPEGGKTLDLVLFLLSFSPVDSPYASDGRVKLMDYDIDVHRYLPNAVDVFAKIALREDPNRKIMEQVLLGTCTEVGYKQRVDRWLKAQNRDKMYPAEFLTRMFALAVTMLPLTHLRPPSRGIETRQPYLLQGSLAAEVIVNMIPDHDVLDFNLAASWLNSIECFGARLVRTMNFMGMVVLSQPEGESHRPFARATQRCVHVIQRLFKLAKQDPDFKSTGIVPSIEHLLGGLMAAKMDKTVVKHLSTVFEENFVAER